MFALRLMSIPVHGAYILLYNPILELIRSNFDSKDRQYISTKSFNYHLISELSTGPTILFITVLATCILFSAL